jgi:RNA polymerase sigma factor (sigma-70 family)
MESRDSQAVPGTKLRQTNSDPLVLENLLLAKWVAARYVGRGLDRDDLDQAAVLGLMRAAQLFDPRRGVKFTTYATWWCRQFVRRAIENEAKTIRLPAHVLQSLGRRARAHARGEQLLQPSECESAALRALWFTAPDEDEEQSFEPADDADGPGELTQRSELGHAVRDAIGKLPERLRTIIERRFGIGCEKENLREIGERLGVSRERVRQLETHALKLLAESGDCPSCLLE